MCTELLEWMTSQIPEGASRQCLPILSTPQYGEAKDDPPATSLPPPPTQCTKYAHTGTNTNWQYTQPPVGSPHHGDGDTLVQSTASGTVFISRSVHVSLLYTLVVTKAPYCSTTLLLKGVQLKYTHCLGVATWFLPAVVSEVHVLTKDTRTTLWQS